MAPIDIVISIINSHKREAEQAKAETGENLNKIYYYTGRSDAYTELVNELEGIKKLFN